MNLTTSVQSQTKKTLKGVRSLILKRFRGVYCKLKGVSSAVPHVFYHWPYIKVFFIHAPFPNKHLPFLTMHHKVSREHATPLNVAVEDTFLQNLLIEKKKPKGSPKLILSSVRNI